MLGFSAAILKEFRDTQRVNGVGSHLALLLKFVPKSVHGS